MEENTHTSASLLISRSVTEDVLLGPPKTPSQAPLLLSGTAATSQLVPLDSGWAEKIMNFSALLLSLNN